jgi:crotonobetainyl-CoA:carnitine CoA-transferase CaiB-like acyl-CoA transferase
MRDADGSVVGSMGLDHERRGVHPLDRLYRTADGWVCISARTDTEFARLCGVPAFAALRDDQRFLDGDARLAHASELEAALTTVFETASTKEWEGVLDAARVACAVPAGPDRPSQFLSDPEQVRLGRVEQYGHPRWGEVSDIAVMVRMGDAQTTPGRPAPEIGQHTREVLAEFGYDVDEIESLYEQGAVR